MPTYEQLIAIGYITYVFSIACAMHRYRIYDKASKILSWLLVLTLVSECIAIFCAYKYRNSYIIYGVFNPIQLLLISLYFNYSIRYFKKKKIGMYIGVIGCVTGLINYLIVQSPERMNSYFLMIESIAIVGMCLYAFYAMLNSDDDMKVTYNPHFWFAGIFLFFWTGMFLHWGLYEFLVYDMKVDNYIIQIVLVVTNAITYTSIGIVFLNYKRMIRLHMKESYNNDK